MKRITKKSIALYITFAVLVVFLTGAQCTIGGCSLSFNDYTAKAVNIKAADSNEYWKDSSGDTLEGVTVSLYAYDPTTGTYSSDAYDSTTVSSGTFTFLSPESNKYKLTASHSDWVFVPQYIEITNSGAASKDLYAFPADTAGQWTIVASWKTASIDVDLSLTYGAEGAGTTNHWTTGRTTANSGERLWIHHNARGTTSGVYHDMDITDDDPSDTPRVETISIYSNSFFTTGDTIKTYITANETDANVTLSGEEGTADAAYVQVDLMNYSGGKATHYGTWYAPWNTAEKSLEIIDMVYQASTLTIYSANNPDLDGGIKSVIWEK